MRRWSWLLLLSVAACDGSCGEGPVDQVCDPGATQACVCAGGASGGQVCNADGTAWESCQCGTPDAGGIDGRRPDASAGLDSAAHDVVMRDTAATDLAAADAVAADAVGQDLILADAGADATGAPDSAVQADARPPTTHSGRIDILELHDAENPTAGHGLRVAIDFTPLVDETVTKIYDDRAADGTGCAAWVYDLSSATPPVAGDHGVVAVTGLARALPACDFQASSYLCPNTGNGADHVTIGHYADPGLFSFTDTDATFVDLDVGRQLAIDATNDVDNYPWHGSFLIIGRISATALVVQNLAPAAQTGMTGFGVPGPGIGSTSNPLDPTSTWRVIAGAEPIFSAVGDLPDAIDDLDQAVVALTAAPGGAFDSFTSAGIPAGDAFSLTPAARQLLTHLPADGSAFTLACDRQVASHTGLGPRFTVGSNGATTLVHDGNLASVRVGAEVIIGLASSSGNDGTFTVSQAAPGQLTYQNPSGVAESFAATTSYSVDDCGSAEVTALELTFNDGDTVRLLTTFTGTGPNIIFAENNPGVDTDDTLTVAHPGHFSPAYFGLHLVVANAHTPANSSTYFPIINATPDSVTVMAINKTTEGFDVDTTYRVFDLIAGLPDVATATRVGRISCLGPGDAIAVPTGAAQALAQVAPIVIRAAFVRAGRTAQANVDGSNPIQIRVGHGQRAIVLTD